MLHDTLLVASIALLGSAGGSDCSAIAVGARAGRGAAACAAAGSGARVADDVVGLRALGSEAKIGGFRPPKLGSKGAPARLRDGAVFTGLSDDGARVGRFTPEELTPARSRGLSKLDESKLDEIAKEGLDAGLDLVDFALDGESLDVTALDVGDEFDHEPTRPAWSRRRLVSALPRTVEAWSGRPHRPERADVILFEKALTRAGAEDRVPATDHAVRTVIRGALVGSVLTFVSATRDLARDPELILQEGSMRASELASCCAKAGVTCIVLACDAYDSELVQCGRMAAGVYEQARAHDGPALFAGLRGMSWGPLEVWRVLDHRTGARLLRSHRQ